MLCPCDVIPIKKNIATIPRFIWAQALCPYCCINFGKWYYIFIAEDKKFRTKTIFLNPESVVPGENFSG